MKPHPHSNALHLDIEVTPFQALAFAHYLKRAGWTHYRQLAVDDEQAYDMQLAAERLRAALARVGFAPR